MNPEQANPYLLTYDATPSEDAIAYVETEDAPRDFSTIPPRVIPGRIIERPELGFWCCPLGFHYRNVIPTQLARL